MSKSPSFQTNPCGVEAGPVDLGGGGGGFQTNPCGVEAACCYSALPELTVFQTNPCGVEAACGVTSTPSRCVSGETYSS